MRFRLDPRGRYKQIQKKQAQPQASPAGLLLPFGGKREGCHRPIQISPLALLRLEGLEIALTRAPSCI